MWVLLEMNSGPLQGQGVLSARPSLQPRVNAIKLFSSPHQKKKERNMTAISVLSTGDGMGAWQSSHSQRVQVGLF